MKLQYYKLVNVKYSHAVIVRHHGARHGCEPRPGGLSSLVLFGCICFVFCVNERSMFFRMTEGMHTLMWIIAFFRWCRQFKVNGKICDTDVEIVYLILRPFYLPREFGCVLLVAVYVPPSGKVTRAAAAVADCVHLMQQQPQ